MSNFYFLALSLPEHTLENPMPLDRDTLDQLLKDNLSYGDYALVQKIFSGTVLEGNRGFLAQLKQFEKDFLIQTVLFRARRLGKKAPFESTMAPCQTLNDLLEKYDSTPLLLHQKLIEYRLEALQKEFNPFSLDALLHQVWRLLELDKWARLNREKGLLELRRSA